MSFHFEESESLMFNTMGNLVEDLSSPQCTYAKGLDDVIGVVGDRIELDVYTRNMHGEANVNPMDKLDIRIYDCNKRKLPLHGSPQRRNSLSTLTDQSVHSFSFTPLKPGAHEIIIKLNNAELTSSPFTCIAYPKLDLKFESAGNAQGRERHWSDGEAVIAAETSDSRRRYHSAISEESDEDTIVYSTGMLGGDFVVQKGGKSSLLRSLTNVPSDIYATDEVQGICAWKMRLTSACMNLMLAVGAKTRSAIPDLDEQFTCDFSMGDFKTATCCDKVNHNTARRKSSMFSRLSWTFTVLLHDGHVRVTCHELGQDKRVEINLLNSFKLFPFCSIIHHHGGNVSQVCPRPQLTLL